LDAIGIGLISGRGVSAEQTQPNQSRPDLAALIGHYQKLLRLQDWRIEAAYEKDLVASDGRPVWGLCYPTADAKTAQIIIRDPATPPAGASADEAVRQVTETIVHELCHLHFAAFENRTPAAIVAEEQAVWALAEALVKSHGTPGEKTIARAMVAIATRPVHARAMEALPSAAETERHAEAGDRSMDKKLATEALDALTAGDAEKCADLLKQIIVGAVADATPGVVEEPPPIVEPLPDEAAVAPVKPEDEEELKAVARVAMSLSGKRTAGEAIQELTRRNRIVTDFERREAEVAKARAVIDASERRELVVKLVAAGEPPAMAWASDADGLPDGQTPAEPWASMPLSALRARVARLPVASRGPRAPAGRAGENFTPQEHEMFRAKRMTPEQIERYRHTKAEIAARARTNPRAQGV
jgi:hypothetical protein